MPKKKTETQSKSNPKESLWILAHQMDSKIESMKLLHEGSSIVTVESKPDLTALNYHKFKIILQISAMRHLKDELEKKGCAVDYYALGDKNSSRRKMAESGYLECLKDHVKNKKIDILKVMEPSEYDLDKFARSLKKKLQIEVEVLPCDLFLMGREAFKQWFEKQHEPVMENFYRQMRRDLNILMEGDFPIGGRWNYDLENRVPPMDNMDFVPPPSFKPDKITEDAINLVDKLSPNSPGISKDFRLPVTRKDVRRWYDDFIENRLKLFGMYQDAMVMGNYYMYHSLISPFLNLGLIDPKTVVKRVEDSYYNDHTPINSAEGFIRQVIGWREYVNGIYWLRMPEYRDLNYFGYDVELPSLLIDGKTRMNCIKEVVAQSLDHGYAHHIQRLMIIGNFCLLTHINPQEVVKWYSEVYIDAYEWVVLPNVLGMILFADGGFLGTKPYAAPANYISKMSNYCKGCFYKYKKRVGEKACPFNFLYWYFLYSNEKYLRNNKRMTMVYNLLHRKTEGEMNLVIKSSETFLDKIAKNGTDRIVSKIG